MEEVRKLLMRSIIRVLVGDLTNPVLDADQRDSLEVGIQCLETTYNLEGHRTDTDIVNLLELVQQVVAAKREKEVTDEDKEKAETLKEEGNQAMKAQHFFLASLKYSEAISLNPFNAVYYCNRAAAYSRLEKHDEAIKDCKNAIRLDPNYGKAYGRLGIAYSSMQNFREAKTAYRRAMELDPDNASYKANYDRADRQLSDLQPRSSRVLDFQQLINSPNVVNIASQMLNDPSFRNVVSDIMNADGRSPNENINVLLQAGQQIAAQVESADPTFAASLRRRFTEGAQGLADQPDDQQPSGSGQIEDKPKPRDDHSE